MIISLCSLWLRLFVQQVRPLALGRGSVWSRRCFEEGHLFFMMRIRRDLRKLLAIFGRFKDSHRVFACLLGCVQCLVGSACNILRVGVSVILTKAYTNR